MHRKQNATQLGGGRTRRSLLAVGCATAVGAAGWRASAAAWPSLPGGSAATGYAQPDWLVEPVWLMARPGDPTVKVVALTPADEFAAGHIPGAAQVDWPALEVTDTSDPSIERWQDEVGATLAALGVRPADTVVVYDGGTLWAARLWWILEQMGHADKRVLNGGLAAWEAAGGELAAGEPVVEPAAEAYAGVPDETALARLDLVVAGVGDPAVVLLDARSAAEYRVGHIPGAVNVDFPLNAEAQPPKVWKPADELRGMYADLGVTADKLVITSCQTGVRAAVAYFTLRLIGYPNVRLFTGSWAEWSSHPALPVATGDQP